MNILGFIAVVLVCLTALSIAYLNYRAHKAHIIYTTPEQLNESEARPTQDEKQENPVEEGKTEHPIAVASMDAVIQSVNELMGVESVKEEKPHGAREE